MSEKIRAAVIGGSECGKSFLVSGFTRGYWRHRRMRSIVFDPWMREPNPTDWGPGAWVTDDFDKWKRVVMGSRGCVVVWDEATVNGGRDRDNLGLLTEIRHRHSVLFCLGHSYSAFLPTMRTCLTDLLLALPDPGDADEWAKVMKDPAVKQALGLQQYQFLHKRSFRPVRFVAFSPAEIRAGILPCSTSAVSPVVTAGAFPSGSPVPAVRRAAAPAAAASKRSNGPRRRARK